MDKIRTAYFAGLIDGEGCMGFHSAGHGLIRIVIQVNMTCEKTVRAIHEHFGVGTVRPKKVYGKEKPQWRWKCSCSSARGVIEEIVPYLITKQDVAQDILKYSQ